MKMSTKVTRPALIVFLLGLLGTAADAIEYGTEVPPGPVAMIVAIVVALIGYFVPEGVLVPSARALFEAERKARPQVSTRPDSFGS